MATTGETATRTGTDTTGGAPRRAQGHSLDRQFIGGEWRVGSSAEQKPDLDPYTGETLVEIRLANGDDLDEAYRSARSAQPAWAAMLPMERASVMSRAATVMEERRDEIVDWLHRNDIWHLVRPSGGADGRFHVFTAPGPRCDESEERLALSNEAL